MKPLERHGLRSGYSAAPVSSFLLLALQTNFQYTLGALHVSRLFPVRISDWKVNIYMTADCHRPSGNCWGRPPLSFIVPSLGHSQCKTKLFRCSPGADILEEKATDALQRQNSAHFCCQFHRSQEACPRDAAHNPMDWKLLAPNWVCSTTISRSASPTAHSSAGSVRHDNTHCKHFFYGFHVKLFLNSAISWKPGQCFTTLVLFAASHWKPSVSCLRNGTRRIWFSHSSNGQYMTAWARAVWSWDLLQTTWLSVPLQCFRIRDNFQ